MDICVLNPFFYPYSGGTEKVLLEIYRRLAKRHNVTVISAGFAGFKNDTEKFGIKIIRLKSRYVSLPGLPLPWPLMDGLNEVLAREKPGVCHINNRYLYYPGTLRTIKRADAGLLLTLHNSLPAGIDPLTDMGGLIYDLAWGRKMMRRADRIVGITKNVLDMTVPQDLRYKSGVIYNGVDMERFRRRKEDGRVIDIRERTGGDEIVLNVARLTAQKGQVYLLRAFSKIVKLRKKARLVIIGSGPLNGRLRKEARRLGIDGKLSILSGVDENLLPFYYNSADVFALPSLYEPASLALLEALASEVPTVASRVGGVPEMMKSCGLYAAPRDVESISDGIELLLSDRKKAGGLSRKGRRLMEKEHDWGKIAAAYEKVLAGIIR